MFLFTSRPRAIYPTIATTLYTMYTVRVLVSSNALKFHERKNILVYFHFHISSFLVVFITTFSLNEHTLLTKQKSTQKM